MPRGDTLSSIVMILCSEKDMKHIMLVAEESRVFVFFFSFGSVFGIGVVIVVFPSADLHAAQTRV